MSLDWVGQTFLSAGRRGFPATPESARPSFAPVREGGLESRADRPAAEATLRPGSWPRHVRKIEKAHYDATQDSYVWSASEARQIFGAGAPWTRTRHNAL